MDRSNFVRQSEFRIEGQFLGFIGESGNKMKYMRVAIAQNEVDIKLSKESRATVGLNLVAGDWIEVSGKKKFKQNTGELKLKAYQINKVSLDSQPIMPMNAMSCSQPKTKILVCQKSGCLKRGGKRLCQVLETALCDRGLQDRVTIERSGCLKRCSSGPNLILMPERTCLNPIHPDAIAALLEKHLVLQQFGKLT